MADFKPNKITTIMVDALSDAISSLQLKIDIDEIEGFDVFRVKRRMDEYKLLLDRIQSEQMDLRMSSRLE